MTSVARSKPGSPHIPPTETIVRETATSLTQRMRERTAQLHATAERTGTVAALLAGSASRFHYALYLRNLLPVYRTMEHALQQRRDQPGFEGLAQSLLYRTPSIVADLNTLAGSDWAGCLSLLPAGDLYASRVAAVADTERLIAHCYTRYLGDLSGGQLLGKCFARQFGSGSQSLAFNSFAGIQHLPAFRAAYREILDRAGDHIADAQPVIEEAAIAFEMNIRLSIDVAWHS